MAIAKNHGSVRVFRMRALRSVSEGILDADQRRDTVGEAVVIDCEKQVQIQQEVVQKGCLRSNCPTHRSKRVLGKDDIRKNRSSVECMEVLPHETICIEDISSDEIEN